MPKECKLQMEEIAEKFKLCRDAISAMGDEVRQLILLALLEGDERGIRVGELAQKVHLTRPAVSRHLRVLKDAEIVNVRQEGTKNYYYLDANESCWETLTELIDLIYVGIKHMGGNMQDSQEE